MNLFVSQAGDAKRIYVYMQMELIKAKQDKEKMLEFEKMAAEEEESLLILSTSKQRGCWGSCDSLCGLV